MELTGTGIESGCTDDPVSLSAAFSEQAGDNDPVVDVHFQLLHFLVHRGFDIVSPDTQDMPVLIIVGKHEPGLFIPEIRSLEYILHVPDLHTHPLCFQQCIPSFPRGNIADQATGVTMGTLEYGPGINFRTYLRTWIGTGAVPVINTRTPGATALGIASVSKRNSCPFLRSTDRRPAACQAAADDEHIGDSLFYFAVLYRVWPFGKPGVDLNEIMPRSHAVF